MYRSRNSSYWGEIYAPNYWTRLNFPRPLAKAFGNLSYVSSSSILTTLVSFISISIFVLKELRRRMHFIRKNKNEMNTLQFTLELEKWRRHHQLACSLIDDINFCFGPCLLLVYLIFTSSVFVINSSIVVVKFENGNGGNSIVASYILEMVAVFIIFFVIIYPSQILKTELIIYLYIYITFFSCKHYKLFLYYHYKHRYNYMYTFLF